MQNQDNQQVTLVIHGLTEAEIRDLAKKVPEAQVTREQEKRNGQEFHSLDLVSAIVIVSVANMGFGALAVWLAKNRKYGPKSLKIHVRKSNGTEVDMEYTAGVVEEDSNPEVVKAITDNMSKTVKAILPAIATASTSDGVVSMDEGDGDRA